MRFGGLVSTALMLALPGSGLAQERDAARPVVFPPPSFKARQYVDQDGCVYIRTGEGNATTWRPRVNRDRSPVCGYEPTLAKAAPGIRSAPAAPVPAAVGPAPAAPVVTAPARGPDAPKPTPPRNAPVAEAPPPADVVTLQGRHDPPYALPHHDATALISSDMHRMMNPVPEITAPCGAAGCKPAFTDGRLNPYRGPRTAAGDQQMMQLWSNGVPARAVAAPRPQVAAPPRATAPAPVVVAGKRFVQVGAFGQPGNAEAAKARLRALGLPVATGRAGRLTVIYAGPFDSGAQLLSALNAARGAGFEDALLR